ncbi:hypothetical protein [Shimazuella kribbensis]|uniref:hypothetical protein n=1 Tax=Shimazuella kribbensis TaxID=139808 RepID=UPI0004058676|nr:hypothetical protein [Shimazuella kribbensis]
MVSEYDPAIISETLLDLHLTLFFAVPDGLKKLDYYLQRCKQLDEEVVKNATSSLLHLQEKADSATQQIEEALSAIKDPLFIKDTDIEPNRLTVVQLSRLAENLVKQHTIYVQARQILQALPN